jgi:hypothetical protein
MIKKKSLEIDENHFKTHLNAFVSNIFLTLKMIKFDNVCLKKNIDFYVIPKVST